MCLPHLFPDLFNAAVAVDESDSMSGLPVLVLRYNCIPLQQFITKLSAAHSKFNTQNSASPDRLLRADLSDTQYASDSNLGFRK